MSAATDTGATTFAQPGNIEAPFPAIANVIPASGKALAAVRVDPVQLASLLDTIAAITDAGTPGNNPGIVMELRVNNLVAFRAGPTETGIRAIGANMGIDDKEITKSNKRKPAAADGPADAELDATRAELARAIARATENYKEAEAVRAQQRGNETAAAAQRLQLDRHKERAEDAEAQVKELTAELAATTAAMEEARDERDHARADLDAAELDDVAVSAAAVSAAGGYYAGRPDRLPKAPKPRTRRRPLAATPDPIDAPAATAAAAELVDRLAHAAADAVAHATHEAVAVIAARTGRQRWDPIRRQWQPV